MKIAIKINQSFLSRLSSIISGRDKHPWGASIGLTTGTIARITKGKVPGPEILEIIQKVENVSLDWLLAGRGRPYLIDEVKTAEECQALLKGIFAGEPGDWRIDVLTDGLRHALALSCMDRYYVEDSKPKEYRHLRLITGQVAGPTLTYLDGLDLADKRLAELPADSMNLIVSGQAGTFALFGDDEHTGLLDGSARAMQLVARIEETSAEYGPHLTAAEARLIDAFRRMEAGDRQRMRAVGDAILAVEAEERIDDGDCLNSCERHCPG